MEKINQDRIIKFLSGQADEEEGNVISRWKKENKENEKTFREIELAWNSIEILMDPEKFDTAHAYARIRSKVTKQRQVLRMGRIVSYAAVVLVVFGLTWFYKGNDFVRQESATGDEPAYQEVESSAGSKTLITLEDGTKVWLNSESKLRYPSHFLKDRRVVSLEGEGYFEVAKDKKRPFEITTPNIRIHVLGTVFNLKAYPEEGSVEATLIEGKIVLNQLIKPGQEKKIFELKPEQQVTFIRKEGRLLEDEADLAGIPHDQLLSRPKEKMVVENHINIDAITAWKDNKMIFADESFESIAIKLQRRYNAKIEFGKESIKRYRFSGIFEEITIDQALNALKFTSTFNFRMEKDKIYIY